MWVCTVTSPLASICGQLEPCGLRGSGQLEPCGMRGSGPINWSRVGSGQLELHKWVQKLSWWVGFIKHVQETTSC